MESVKDLLTDQLKGKNRAQGVLCLLFREILNWNRVTQISWNKRLTAYFEKPHNQEKPDKGNLNKALLNDHLPWAGFKKAMDFLSPEKVTLSFEFVWQDKTENKFELVIDPAADETTYNKDVYTYAGCPIFKKAKKPTSTLAYLFRHIVATRKIDEAGWEQLFQDYANCPTNTVGTTPAELNSTVSQLKRALLDGKISWDTFRRGIQLLGVRCETYTLDVIWSTDPKKRLQFPDEQYSAVINNPYVFNM